MLVKLLRNGQNNQLGYTFLKNAEYKSVGKALKPNECFEKSVIDNFLLNCKE